MAKDSGGLGHHVAPLLTDGETGSNLGPALSFHLTEGFLMAIAVPKRKPYNVTVPKGKL